MLISATEGSDVGTVRQRSRCTGGLNSNCGSAAGTHDAGRGAGAGGGWLAVGARLPLAGFGLSVYRMFLELGVLIKYNSVVDIIDFE